MNIHFWSPHCVPGMVPGPGEMAVDQLCPGGAAAGLLGMKAHTPGALITAVPGTWCISVQLMLAHATLREEPALQLRKPKHRRLGELPQVAQVGSSKAGFELRCLAPELTRHQHSLRPRMSTCFPSVSNPFTFSSTASSALLSGSPLPVSQALVRTGSTAASLWPSCLF